ncbi:methyltransferase domain-containing protein [Candidatus Binatia bacterium]|nr:methyltransferase domain-containing protein [Candidatus Binatia bacterium]
MSDRAQWHERHRARPERSAPSPFVARHAARVARRLPGAPALDLACGSGRHSILLAEHGFRTVALDYAASACRRVAEDDGRILAVVADAAALPFRATTFALIVQTRFLDRAIIPELLRLLVRGGELLIETFLVAQYEATGHPRRSFCLEPGELARLCGATAVAVEIVEMHEGLVGHGDDAAHLAAIAVRKV